MARTIDLATVTAKCKKCGKDIFHCRFRDLGGWEPDYNPDDDPVVWRHANGYAYCGSPGFAEPA